MFKDEYLLVPDEFIYIYYILSHNALEFGIVTMRLLNTAFTAFTLSNEDHDAGAFQAQRLSFLGV